MKISEHIVDYCKRWNVGVELMSSDNFSKLIGNSKFSPAPFNRTGIYSTYNKKIIYVGDDDRITLNSIDDKVLHELAHILMRMAPKFIDEFNSPYFLMWYKMMQATNSKHRLMDQDFFNKFPLINTLKLNLFEVDLIRLGLVKETGEFTFNYSKVKPQKSWLKNFKN